MPLTLNNTNTLTADNIILSGTNLSDLYATKDEVGNNAQISTNTDDIAILNTKQLQNFNNINAINDDLTNNYQTNTVLATNFYNKTEIDATFTNYYTSTQKDTNLSTNYQNNTQIQTNYYNKTEIDANKWIDATALTPYALTATLTANYQTNSQLATNYYSKTEIDANNWIDNTALAPYATTATLTANYYNKGEVDTLIAGAGGGVDNPIELVDANTSIERYTNATKANVSLDLRTDQEAMRLVLGGASDGDTNTYLECNNNTGGTTLFKQSYFKDTLNYENTDINISNNSGLTFYKDTTDASNVMCVKNAQGYLKCISFGINAYNTNNDSSSLLLLNTANGNGVYCLSLGIGVIQGSNKLNVGGGNANFGSTASFQSTSTFNGDIYVNNQGRIYQRDDNGDISLNIIHQNKINFCIQSNRNLDPTGSDIKLSIQDGQPFTFNDDVDINFPLYCASTIEAVGASTLPTINTDTINPNTGNDVKINVSTVAGSVNFSEDNVDYGYISKGAIQFPTVRGQTDVQSMGKVLSNTYEPYNQTGMVLDAPSVITFQISSVPYCEVFPSGFVAYNGFNLSSDKRLKDNIKDVEEDTTSIVKKLKAKTFTRNDQEGKSHIGFIAQDIQDNTPEYYNIVNDSAKYLSIDANKMTAILWSCVDKLINRIEALEEEIKELKPKAKAKPKAKSKN